MSEPPAPGAFFPFVHDELRRLAARLAGKAKGYSLGKTAKAHSISRASADCEWF